MAGSKALVELSFSGAIGLTFLILLKGVLCLLALVCPDLSLHLPHSPTSLPKGPWDKYCLSELAFFFTTGIVVSPFGFPVILACVTVIKWGVHGLVLTGNAVIFLKIQGFFLVFGRGDDFSWEQW